MEVPKVPTGTNHLVDAHREVHKEEYKMPAEDRQKILDRVMGVLVEEEGGRLVLSNQVKRIMIKYKNVKKISTDNDSDQATFPEQTQSTFPDSTHTSSSQPTFTENNSQSTFSDNTSSNLTSNSKLKRPRKRAKKTKSNSPKDVGEPLEKKPRSDSSTIRYVKMESEKEYQENIMKRIERVLEIASKGLDEPITYYQYEMAVCQQPERKRSSSSA